MLGTLLSMLYFQKVNKLKLSDSLESTSNLQKMKTNGLKTVGMAIVITSLGALFVMWNTFPDSIAVYNPFEKKIELRNLNNVDSFIMFIGAAMIVLCLVLNSLFFTSKTSKTLKAIAESSKICLSLTLLGSEYWACYATVLPTVVFFIVLYMNYSRGNIYGVTVEYLGILTYF